MYIAKINDYLKLLTDDEVKEFAAINFGEYFKSTREKLYSKLNEEQNLRKCSDAVKKYAKMMQLNSSGNYVNRYNI